MAYRAVLISFGLGGHGVEFAPEGACSSSHLSGYENPQSFERRLAGGDYAKYDIRDGVPVLDKRPAVERDPGFAFRSPLVDARIPDGGPVDRIATRWGADMARAGEAMWGQSPDGRPVGEPGPLDGVSVADYVAWWRRAGARVGRLENGAIVWEGGE